MPTPMQVEDALRRALATGPTPVPSPAPAASGPAFGKPFTPEDRMQQQLKLAELLRSRR